MRKLRAAPFVILISGLALLLYAILPHGIGLSEDSISYLSAAHSLQDTGEMRDINGDWFVSWAPLYPLCIAILQVLPWEAETALAALNLLLFGLTVISSWVLITKVLETPFFRVACLVAIVFSFTIMQVYATALSEALFLLVVNLVVLAGTGDGGRGTRDYVVLGVLCGAAMLTRYAGVFLLPAVVVSFWGKKERIAIWKMVVFVVIAVAPLAVWLVRNEMLTDTPMGFRLWDNPFFVKDVLVLGDTITSWILPIKIPLVLRSLLLVGMIAVLFKGWTKPNLRIHLLTATGYLLFLVLAYKLSSFEEPRDRLLAPVFVSFFILVFAGVENLTLRFPSVPYLALAACTCLWLAYPVVRVGKHVQLWHNEGVDVYNKPAWDDSETIAWLKETGFNQIFSNDAHAIYYFTGKNAVHISKPNYNNSEFFELAKSGDYVVWWKNKPYYGLAIYKGNPPFKNAREEKVLNDAVIYRVGL